MQSQEAQPLSNYLAYVGLIEGLRQIRSALTAWLVLTGIGYGVSFFWNLGASSIFERFDNDFELPKWAGIALFVGAMSWMLRGQTVRVPRFSFKAWALSLGGFAGYLAIVEYAPWWASLPLLTVLAVVSGVYEDLNELGRDNYERQREARPEIP
jgi:hypothetical protein